MRCGRGLTAVISQSLRDAITGPDATKGTYATGSVVAAATIGSAFGDRATARGIDAVYWARPGRYHGKIKAFIDAVREKGIRTIAAPPRKMPPAPTTNN